MTEIPRETYQVHTILDRYISIHDKIFKFSLRKAIPIPGIFKPIDYGQHFRELDSLASELEQLAIPNGRMTGPQEVFQQYVMALFTTIKFLRDICRRLHQKSDGDLQSYTMNQYNADVATYEELVEKYRQIGSTMNESIQKWKCGIHRWTERTYRCIPSLPASGVKDSIQVIFGVRTSKKRRRDGAIGFFSVPVNAYHAKQHAILARSDKMGRSREPTDIKENAGKESPLLAL